jgi:hypothetical protein
LPTEKTQAGSPLAETAMMAIVRFALAIPLQRRATEAHSHFIGAVLGARFAYLIGVTHVTATHADEVLIGPVVRYSPDHYSITVDVDIGRVRPGPGEIHRVPALHSAPDGAEVDLGWRWCWCRPRLHLKRPDVNATVTHAPKTRAALIVVGRRSKVRVSGINGRAATQQRVRQRGSAVVLQRSKHRVGVDLVPWTRQITAAVIAAYIVTMGGDGAIDVGARIVVQDRVSNHSTAGGNAAADGSGVAADRAVRDGPAAIDTATGLGSIVVAESAVGDGAAPIDAAAVAPRLAIMLATSPVTADGAAGDRQRPAAVVDAATSEPDLITIDRAVGNRQRPVVVDAAANTHGERIGRTSVVVSHDAVGDHQRPAAVVDAAAGAARVIIALGKVGQVVAYDAVHDRQCRAAAIGGIVVDAATSIIAVVAADGAAEYRQCRAAP